MSYIVKNCPATGAGCCGDTCPEITDCVLKQIVNECANSLRFSCERILAEKLLSLLDIQEVE